MTVCASQSEVVNSRLVSLSVAILVSPLERFTVTVPVGWLSSSTL